MIITKNCVVRVHGDLVFSGISDETLSVCKSDIAGGSSVSLIIGDDFDLSVLKNSNTGVGGSKINTNCGSLGHFVFLQILAKNR